MSKPSQIQSSVGVFIIILILGIVGFYGYSGYKKVIKTQEETIISLQQQLSEIQTKSNK